MSVRAHAKPGPMWGVYVSVGGGGLCVLLFAWWLVAGVETPAAAPAMREPVVVEPEPVAPPPDALWTPEAMERALLQPILKGRER